MDAQETLRQLGGNKFIAMTGARNFTKDRDSIIFKLPRAKNGIRIVKITLNQVDTYDINFMSASGKIIKQENNIYNDQLQEVFTQNTGLHTHL